METGAAQSTCISRRFKVVNFAPESTFDHTFHTGALSLRLSSVAGAEAITSTLGVRDLCAVTALAEVSGGDDTSLIWMADTVCELLSYARGTRVQWISYEDVGENNEVLKTHYGNRITRRLSPMDLIEESKIFTFVEQTLAPYAEFREVFPYRKLLGLYLDACDQTDFIDVRAIKIVVLMEAIKAILLEKNPLPPIFPSKSKARLFAAEIRNAIEATAQELELSNEATESLIAKSGGCNHPTFRECIDHVQKLLRIRIERNNVTTFINARNRLIHEATFLHLAQPNRELPFSNHAEEYFWLVSFVDRFVLRLIGYRGPYLDRASHEEGLISAESD